MFECRATERMLAAMVELGAALHHPLEQEARSALRNYAATGSFDRKSRITLALLPALTKIAARVARRSRPRGKRQDAL